MPNTKSDTRTAFTAALKQRILVLDGAMGTMIQALKLDEEGFRGARFDAWTEHFRAEAWEQGFASIGSGVEAEATRTFAAEAPLPWDDIDARITKDFLLEEKEKAERAEATGDDSMTARAHHLLGVVTSEPETARGHFERALSLAGEDPVQRMASLNGLAREMGRAGDYEGARPLVEEASTWPGGSATATAKPPSSTIWRISITKSVTSHGQSTWSPRRCGFSPRSSPTPGSRRSGC